MSSWGGTARGSPEDPAYPTHTPPDAVLPCQTLEPIGAPLDGVATPAMWSRLETPMEQACSSLWRALGLLRRGLPARFVSIHFGRIALNAHGWERLRACLFEAVPDPSLVPPTSGRGERLAELFERTRSARRRRDLPAELRAASTRAAGALEASRSRPPAELDAGELARGGLDARAWSDVLLPWLVARLRGEDRPAVARAVADAIGEEQRIGAELGRRLVARGIVQRPSDVAYLTTEERIRAVHGDANWLLEAVSERRDRIENFLEVELPLRFWGRPRVEQKETR